MKYKYHITSEVKKWWDKKNLGPKFQEELKNFLTSDAELCFSGSVGPLYGKYRLVRFKGYSSRPTFIWEPVEKGNATLYVLRAAYVHDDYEKEVTIPMQAGWMEKHQITLSEREEIDAILDSMISNDNAVEIKELKPLTESEYGFISNPLHINHDLFEETIYETEEWVDYIKSDRGFSDYYTTAEKIEEHIFEHLSDEDGWQIVQVKDKHIFVYHDGKNWILSDLKKSYEKDDFSELLLRDKPTVYRRGYPYTFLEDKDGWRDMELEKKSNMVLSEEQVKIVVDDIQYPLFITGRAGSGKSTALQYLFAEIILRYTQHKTNNVEGGSILPPVYLSYSENLIADAKSLTSILLKKNSKYVKAIKDLCLSVDEDVFSDFDNMFYVFQSLVRQCIQVNDKDYLKTHFLHADHISYATFNNMWNHRFAKVKDAAKKYGPSDSWHVIRTYIKGWDSKNILSPDAYKSIPRSDKSVSEEMFCAIFEKVWEPWYSKISCEGYWDDQDLVRYCLDNNYAGEQFSAIFCDESQDFTRVELDFIMKISSFANRKIESVQDVKKLPFVFAGDEFQTLNPTGFSWRSLRGYFAEHICDSVGLNEQVGNIRLDDPVELSENFRSTRQVVKLANRIQLLRASRFGEDSKPQSPHFPQDGSPIVCLSPNDKMVFEELRKKGVILIVPAADGESVEEYIEKSPLKGKIEFEEGASVGITILNPTQAKGLEYPNVAIYGFNCEGRYSSLSLTGLLSWFDTHWDNIGVHDSDIDLKYHLSNAYVAVTRAGTKLFIIDDFDKTSFWGFAFNHSDPKQESLVQNLEQKMLEALSPTKRKQWDRDLLGWINPGTAEDITAENIAYLDKEENKNSLENRAESLMDVGLMRQAASRHKEAGRKADENRCRAKAYMFEDNYIKAAEYFSDAELYVESIDNYWKGINKSIEEKNSIDSTNIPDIITKIARLNDKVRSNKKVDLCVLLNTKPSLSQFARILDELCTYFRENENELVWRAAWGYIINLVMSKLTYSNEDSNAMNVIVRLRSELANFKIDLDSKKLAVLAYEWNLLGSAILIWEEMDKSQLPSEYYKAKVKTLQYPQNLEYLEFTKEDNWTNMAIDAYRKSPDELLTDSQKAVLSRAIRVSGSAEEYALFLPFMLRSANSLANANAILKDAESVIKLANLNMEVLKAVMNAKHTNLVTWNAPKIRYVDARAKELFETLAFLRNVRNGDYVNRVLGLQTPSKELNNFCNNTLRRFAQKDFAPVLFFEVGKMIEKRNNFVECKSYFQNIRGLYNDSNYKRETEIRALWALERLAELKEDPKTQSEINALRNELNLSQDYVVSQFASVPGWAWEVLIQYALTISNELAPEDDKKVFDTTMNHEENAVSEVTNTDQVTNELNANEELHGDATISTSHVGKTTAKQSFKFGDYEISFSPRKNEVIIRYTKDDDDYQVKIKKGVVREDDEFKLIDNHLHFTEIDLVTPFVLNLSERKQVIHVYDGDEMTGMSFVFVCADEE